MAIVGKIINKNSTRISVRDGNILCNISRNKEYFQIRTHAMGNLDRKMSQNRTFN